LLCVSYLLEVCVGSIELKVFTTVDESSAMLDDASQADSCPSSVPDGAFSPGGVDQLVTFASIFRDLFDPPCPAALYCYHDCFTREKFLVLQIGQGKVHWVLYKAIDLEKVLGGIDHRNTTVITDEIERIGRDGLLCQEALVIELACVKKLLRSAVPWVVRRCKEIVGDAAYPDVFLL